MMIVSNYIPASTACDLYFVYVLTSVIFLNNGNSECGLIITVLICIYLIAWDIEDVLNNLLVIFFKEYPLRSDHSNMHWIISFLWLNFWSFLTFQICFILVLSNFFAGDFCFLILTECFFFIFLNFIFFSFFY